MKRPHIDNEDLMIASINQTNDNLAELTLPYTAYMPLETQEYTVTCIVISKETPNIDENDEVPS